MTRALILVVAVLLVAVSAAHAAKPAHWCNVDAAFDSGSATWTLHVTGSVAMKTVPYLSLDGSQSWTSLHNQKGTIDDWTSRTAVELPAGSHVAEIIDAPNGVVGSSVVASCSFVT